MDPVNPPPPIRRIDPNRIPAVRIDGAPPAAGAGPTVDGARSTATPTPLGSVAEASTEVLEAIPTLAAPPVPAEPGRERMRCERVTIAYGGKIAVNAVDLPVHQGEVLALIGPSGCGKTTLLRSLNRLTELTPTAARGGRITLDGEDIDRLEVTRLRRRVSMVFQQPNPFPMSIFDNVAYALREHGEKRRRRPRRSELTPRVEEALSRAGLLEEVADDLSHPALRLSGGQQQRLCIARSLAASPEVLLLDEPCSALDPRSTTVIEQLITRLKREVAVVIVTHNLQQARRIADRVAFMYLGELVEYGPVAQVFEAPRARRTSDYVQGAFG